MYLYLALILCLPLTHGKPSFMDTMVMIKPDASFMNYINMEEGERIVSCRLNYTNPETNDTIFVDLEMERAVGYEVEVFGGRLFSLGRNLCGIKIVKLRNEDPTKFQFRVNYTDVEAKVQSWSSFFNLILYQHVKLKDEAKRVDLGKPAEVTCGQQNVQKSCILVSPMQETILRQKKCDYTIPNVTMEHIGLWTCYPTIVQTMGPTQETMELQVNRNYSLETWYREENGVAKIGCQYFNELVKPPRQTYCILVRPDDTVLTVTNFGATLRYTSLTADLESFKCQIEFKLPLLQEEKGRWKCKMYDMGGFLDTDTSSTEVGVAKRFSLPNTKTKYKSSTKGMNMKQFLENIRKTENGKCVFCIYTPQYYPKEEQMWVAPGDRFHIHCQVPFKTDFCIIESPTGKKYPAGSFGAFWMGECRMLGTLVASEEHGGRWRCLYSTKDKSEADIVVVDVKLFSHPKATDVDVQQDQSLELLCETDHLILGCRFVDPQGRSYHLSPKKMKAKDVTYLGKGLDNGECGLRIEKARPEHTGTWTCFVKSRLPKSFEDMGEGNATLRVSVRLGVIGTLESNAAAIGVPAGLMAAAILTLILVIYKSWKKHQKKALLRRPRASNESSDSATNMPITVMAPSAPTYTEEVAETPL